MLSPEGGDELVVGDADSGVLGHHGEASGALFIQHGVGDAAPVPLADRAEPEARLGGGVAGVPLLTAEGGRLLRQMPRVVPEHHPDALPLHLHQAYGGVVPVAGGARLLQGQALRRRKERAQCRAVAGVGDGPPGVLRRDLEKALHGPRADLGEGLRPLRPPQVGVLVEVDIHLQVLPLDLRPGLLLPVSQADLPEQGLRPERQIPGYVQRRGGGVGAGEVAAVDSVQLLAPEALPQVGQLPVSPGGEVAVVLSVGHPEEVALRLRVADQENLCGHGRSPL